ncbi:unknown [Prevotella sp. CAG:1058]|nr:unknown [Prevotella sp. CAG:1058]
MMFMPPSAFFEPSRRHSLACLRACSSVFSGASRVPAALSLPAVGDTNMSPAGAVRWQQRAAITVINNFFMIRFIR